MKGIMKRISKFVLKLLITDALLIGLAFLISYFSKMNISDLLVYIGIICLIIGGFSMMGSGNNSGDAKYFMSKSIGTKSSDELTEENYKSRNSSMRFLLFMFCAGALLIAVVVLKDLIYK